MKSLAELKTRPNGKSVEKFLNSVEDERKRKDSFEVLEMMKSITKDEPIMWGDSIIGFGNHHFVYESGRELDWFLVGFSPRKQYLTLYMMTGYKGYDELLEKLGKHKTGKSCLYIKKLDDIDKEVLKELIEKSVEDVKKDM